MPVEPPDDELADLWRRVRGELETCLPPATFRLWLDPLRPVAVHGSTLMLSAPASVRTWVERRYTEALTKALVAQTESLTAVGFIDLDTPTSGRDLGPTSLPIDESHTFDSFVIGPENRLAHAAALAVAELPGEAYNPLFLHGPPGLGKTHLLGAIAGYLRENHPQLTVHYTTAERFTSEFVGALRRDGPELFKTRYRELDALLIDDVQVLEGKQRTEEEFVHTFNALHAAGKQVVLSSDRPPEALSRLAERLRDRFRWGLQVELERPDLRTRIAVLWRLASASGDPLPEPEVLREIATRTPENVRVLEGAMTRVLAISSLLSEPLSMPLVRRALDGPAGRPPSASRPAPSLDAIQDAVCRLQGLTRAELLSPRRSARVARARQLAMYLARELTSHSLAELARGFDRDHSTVLHAIRTVSAKLEPGSPTASAIHSLRAELRTSSAQGLPSSPDADNDPPVGPGRASS